MDIIEWINKHKLLCVILLLMLFFLFLLIVNVLFKCHWGIDFLVAEWSAGDILVYIGSFLSFVGSMALGFIAIYQNKQMWKINNKLMELEKNTYMSNSCSDIIIRESNVQSCIREQLLSNEADVYVEGETIFLELRNEGRAVLNNISFIFPDKTIFKSHLTLSSGNNKNIKLKLPKNIDDWLEKRVKIVYESCYGIKTYGSFVIYQKSIKQYSIKYYHYNGLWEEKEND